MTVAWAAHPPGIRLPLMWTWIQLLRKLVGQPNTAYVIVGTTSPSGPGDVQDNGPGGTGVTKTPTPLGR